MAGIAMAFIVTACIAIAYVVIGYIVMARPCASPHPCSHTGLTAERP